MKVLALNGSPRKDGNTAKLLKKITEDHQDVDLKYYDLADLSIKDCTSCFYCKQHEACAVKDDMTKIYRGIKEADAIVLGSPLYMGAETALLKAVVDRTFALVAFGDQPREFVPRLSPGKKGVAVFTCGNPRGDQAYPYMKDRFYSYFAFAGITKVKVEIVGGLASTSNVLESVKAQEIIHDLKRFIEN